MRDTVADAADEDGLAGDLARRLCRCALTMRRIDPVLPPSLQNRVDGDESSLIEDAQLVRQLVDLDDAPRAVGHAIVIAADRDEAVMADTALELQQGIEGECRQRLELSPLGSKGFGDDPLGGAVQPDIGHRVKPIAQLSIEIVEVAEGTGQEEVLAYVAERPLHLAFCLGAVRPAGLGLEAVMARQRQQRTVIDDVALVILADHRRLHTIIKNLNRHPANRLEGQHVAAQQRLQVLMHDEAGEDEAGVSEHQREQPDDAGKAWFVGEGCDKAGEVDLRLIACRGLKADLERLGLGLRSDRRNVAFDRGVGAPVAALLDLARQPLCTQIGIGRDTLTQIVEIGCKLARPADPARPVDRRLEAAFDVFADRLGIASLKEHW